MARSSGNLGPDFVEGLRQQADIVRILSDYVTLKKAGRSWKGLCPFHREKTPSFTVDEAKGVYYCFGCREGGDLFGFLMKMEGIGFPDAVRAVADRCGVEVPSAGPGANRDEGERRRLLEANRLAAEWFRRNLASSAGAAAREYLARRGLDGEVLELFAVGYAPPGWDNLLRHLGGRFRPEELEAAGLAVARRSGPGHYDRFRDRLLFPIRDLRGRVLGFGGRVMPGADRADEPKYLNTPETPVYRKGRVLYGLETARAHARDHGWVVLVEGYTDVLALHRHCIGGAVGVCGTALTAEQSSLLARFARTVYVNFDADRAGRSAAARGLELLLEAGLEVRAITLPAGDDPASYLDREGAPGYHRRMQQADDLLGFFLDSAASAGDLGSARGKVAVLEEVLPFVSRLPDRILRLEFGSRLAHRLEIDDTVVLERMRRALASGRPRLTEDTGQGPSAAAPGRGPTEAERGLLRAILEGTSEALADLVAEDVAGLEAEPIFLHLIAMRDAGEEVSYPRLLERLGGGPVAGWVGRIAAAGEEEHRDPADCLRTLRRMQVERRIRRLQRRIHAAERAGDAGEADRLAMEKLELNRHLRVL